MIWYDNINNVVVSEIIFLYERELKSSYTEKFIWWHYISYLFFDQWNQCTSTLMVIGPQGGLCWKINFIWSISIRVSWSPYELFSSYSYVHEIWVKIKENTFYTPCINYIIWVKIKYEFYTPWVYKTIS